METKFLVIDYQGNSIEINSYNIRLEDIKDLSKSIKKHKTRKDLFKTISEFMNERKKNHGSIN